MTVMIKLINLWPSGVGRLGVGRRINDFVDYSTHPPSRSRAGPLIEHSFFFLRGSRETTIVADRISAAIQAYVSV